MTDYRPMANNTPVARLRDPFYVVREKVQLAHATITSEYDRWRDLLDGGAADDDFTALSKSLKVSLTALRIDLADLQRTNTIVEKNRSRFKDIDDEELASRSKFCSEMEAGLKAIEDHLNSPKVSKRVEKTRDALMSGGKKGKKEAEGPASSVVQAREMQMQEEMAQQDEIAIAMGDVVNRLKDVAQEANRELTAQNESIKGLDSALDHAKHNMDVVMAKLNTLLGSSDKGKLCCIAFLVFLCALLLILIVYT